MPGDEMNPIDGNALLLAAAKASVGPQLLPELVERVQANVGPRIHEYRERYETAHETDDYAAFFVESDHWDHLGDAVGLGARQRDAVRRAHTEHLRLVGSSIDRRDEFETSLEIREVVVIGKE